MSTYTCPEGHTSSDGDYCDVCGTPITGPSLPAGTPSATPDPSDSPASSLDLDAPAAAVPDAPVGQVCPSCSVTGQPDALFCENCGYDFTTGQMPRPLDPPAAPSPVDQRSSAGASADPLDGPPAAVQPPPSDPAPQPAPDPDATRWVVEIWVDPDWHAAQDVDDPCPSPGMPTVVPLSASSVLVGRTSASRNIHPDVEILGDTGVSRRHAQLTTDGRRWFVEDLASANGTYVGTAGSPLPVQAISTGQRTEIVDDGRIYLGAWTRMVIRKALASEV